MTLSFEKKQKVVEISSWWSDLHDDVLREIISRLSLVDQVHCGAVCRNWRRLISKGGIRPADKLPWRLLFDWRESKEGCIKGVCKLSVPFHQKTYTFNAKNGFNGEEWRNFSGAKCSYSRYGWVFFCKIQEDQDDRPTAFFFAFCPFTNETLILPKLEVGKLADPGSSWPFFSIRKALFNSIPSSSDCVFFALCSRATRDKSIICTFRPGDPTWKSSEIISGINGEVIKDAAYFDGTLYCLFGWGTLVAFDVAKQQWSCLHSAPYRYGTGGLDLEWNVLMMDGTGQPIRLVRGCGVPEMRILRFDFSQKNWVNAASLGDHAAFVAPTSFSDNAAFAGTTSFLIPATGEASEYCDTVINSFAMKIYSFKTGKIIPNEPAQAYGKNPPVNFFGCFIQPFELYC